MKRNKYWRASVVGLAGWMAVLAGAVGNGQDQETGAVENAKKLVRESLQFYKRDMEPLQQEASAKMATFHAQVALQLHYLDELKSADDSSLAKVREELQRTSDRLKMLVRLESVLTDMNPDAIPRAITEGNQQIAAMEDQRNELAQPLNQEMSVILQANAHRNEELTSMMNPFFKSVGVDELSGLVRKYPSGNFVYAQYACRYEDEQENVVIHVTLQFSTKLSAEANAVARIDDKHVVYQWNDDQVILLINGMQLNVHDASKKFTKQELMAVVRQLIDLDGLSRLGE